MRAEVSPTAQKHLLHLRALAFFGRPAKGKFSKPIDYMKVFRKKPASLAMFADTRSLPDPQKLRAWRGEPRNITGNALFHRQKSIAVAD